MRSNYKAFVGLLHGAGDAPQHVPGDLQAVESLQWKPAFHADNEWIGAELPAECRIAVVDFRIAIRQNGSLGGDALEHGIIDLLPYLVAPFPVQPFVFLQKNK